MTFALAVMIQRRSLRSKGEQTPTRVLHINKQPSNFKHLYTSRAKLKPFFIRTLRLKLTRRYLEVAFSLKYIGDVNIT